MYFSHICTKYVTFSKILKIFMDDINDDKPAEKVNERNAASEVGSTQRPKKTETRCVSTRKSDSERMDCCRNPAAGGHRWAPDPVISRVKIPPL